MTVTTNVETNPHAAPPAARKKSGSGGWIVVLAVLVIAGIAAAAWWNHEHGKSSLVSSHHKSDAEGGEEESGAVSVDAVQPKAGGIVRTSTQTGSVHAYEDADLYAKVSGYLKTLNVDIGDHVKAGQELATIDDPELVKDQDHAAAVLAQSKAAVKQAEAHIESAKANALSAKAKVKEAEAEVASYTSRLGYRQKELARYRDLYERQAVQKSVIEEEEEHVEAASASRMASVAAVETAKAQYEESKAKIDQATADLEESKAEVQVAEANLAKAKVLVGYMSIKSPYTGVITSRLVHPGAFIRSAAEGNEKPLLTVARTDLMRIVTYVPDRDVPYTDVGDPVEVDLDALTEPIQGKVTRFSDSEVPESRTMRTEIIVPNPTGRIREGMFGQATITLQQTNAALTIPTACLVGASKGGKAKVFVVRDGKAKEIPITIGVDDGIKVEVVTGLSPDDHVVVSHGSITDGTSVKVMPEKKPGAKAAS